MALFRGMGARKDSVTPFLGTPPLAVRKSMAALFVRPGVLPGCAMPLVTGNATWAYNVGVANFVTSRGASDGMQMFGNDGVALIGTTGVGSTVPVAPAAGLQRIDVMWTRHPTNLENSDTSSEPLFGVTSGVAVSSGPVAPAIPTGALELGRNLMTSAATSTASAGNTITQTALYTGLRGTPVLVRNQGERDALTATAHEGDRAYRLDLDTVETYNGTAWVGTASLRYDSTTASYAIPAANTIVAPTTWSTPTFNVGDITYAAGVFTVHTAGKYRWDATVQWPGASASYRVIQAALVDGVWQAAGEASMQFIGGTSGAQWITSGFTVDLAAGGTVQLGLQCSTGGLTGVQPVAFCLTRVA